MQTIGVLSRKGGSGKTTVAVHLAVLAQEAGRRTLLIDLDPQRSATGWWRARQGDSPLMVECDPDSLTTVLDGARHDGIDLCVIDTRGSVEADTAQVASVSDLVILPVRPGVLDLRAVLGTIDIVRGSRAMIVLNATPHSRRGDGEASVTNVARCALSAFGVAVATPTLTQRTAFSQALTKGLTATEAEPDGKASKEVRRLWHAVERELND